MASSISIFSNHCAIVLAIIIYYHQSMSISNDDTQCIKICILLYTFPLVKWEVFRPSHVNYMCLSRFHGSSTSISCSSFPMNRDFFIDINPLMVVVRGWSVIYMDVVWGGGRFVGPTFTLQIWFSWWCMETIHFAPIVPEEVDGGRVVGWSGWSARHWGYGAFVLLYVLPGGVMPVA